MNSKQSKGNSVWKPISVLVMLVLFAYVFSKQDLHKLWQGIQSIPLAVFLLLLGMQVLTQALLCCQWTLLARKFLASCGFWGMFRVLAIGSLVEALTPGAKVGGELSKLYYLKKDFSCTTEIAAHIIVIQKSISMSVLFSICSLSGILWTTRAVSKVSKDVMDTGLLWGMGVVPLLFLLILACPKYLSKLPLPKKVQGVLEGFSQATQALERKQWLLQFGISTAVWLLFPLKMLILTASVGLRLDLLMVFAMTMISYASGMLPLTPGGLGTFEGTMLSLFALLSVETELAFALTIVFRFVTFWFVMILCGLTQIFTKRSS